MNNHQRTIYKIAKNSYLNCIKNPIFNSYNLFYKYYKIIKFVYKQEDIKKLKNINELYKSKLGKVV